MQLPLVQLAEEGLIEDPHPSNVEAMLPPIAKAVAMHERIEEQTKDASTQAQVSQRLLPSLTPSELLGLSGADLRHLSPEQYVLEQQHLLMPDPLQASLDEAAPEAETAAAAVDEWDKLMNLAATEQHPRLVGYVRQIVGDIPQISSLERFSVSEPQDEGCSEVFIEEGGGPEEEEPLFEIDLGAFELVDTGISAEELLTNEDPVIYHKDLPVHSVHHDTVQTEAAIHNLINAPQSMLTTQIPPTMVADNYCFAVDGDRIQMADILGDEHWWRHTSRPTKYFYSEDLRRFYRVNLLTVRGRIVSARLANTTPAMGGTNSAADMMAPELAAQQPGADFLPGASFSLPSTARRSLTFCTGSAGRPSFVMPSMDPAQYEPTSSSSAAASHQMGAAGSLSMFPPSGGPAFGRHSIAPIGFIQQQQQQQTTAAASALAGSQQQPQWQQPEMAQRGEQVHLGNVYRVVRFYSFWRTCTAFHRIVTMLERVGHSPGRSQSQKQLPSYSRQAAEGLPPSSAHSDSSSSAAAKSSSMVRPGSSSGGFGGGGSSRGAPPPPPDFQKRLFVQYLWRNIKPGDKARVQREFDPRRQRLLKYVADSAARKRMTGAKMQQQQFGRSGSAGPSSSSGGGRAQRTPPLPPPAASCTSAAQSPSAQSARGSIRFRLPSDNRSLPPPGADSSRSSRPHSSPVSPMRRAKTAGEIGKPAAAGRSRDGGGGSRPQSRQATTRPASRADSGASSSRTTTEKSPRR